MGMFLEFANFIILIASLNAPTSKYLLGIKNPRAYIIWNAIFPTNIKPSDEETK